MRFKNFKLIISAFSLGLMLLGCIKHPLDQTPTGEYTTGTYWRNQSDVIAGVLGIYNVLYTEDWVGHDLYAYDNQSNDIAMDGNHPDMISIESFNADPTLQLIYVTWPFAYEQIERANNALIYIPKVPASAIDPAIQSRSMGEAYFLRAHAYFILSQIYGDVPLILEQNVQSESYNVRKSAQDTVWMQVESDLLKAASLLPETYDAADRGRVSKGAAWGMLSKLYLFENNFPAAITYGDSVINDPNYALAPNYTDNFTPGVQQAMSPELLFAVWNQNSEVANSAQSSISIYFTPGDWQGWGFHHPTQNFADEFEAKDTIRKQATLISVGDTIPFQTNLTTITGADAYQMFTGMTGQKTGRFLPSMSNTGYCIKKYTAFMPSGDGNINFDLKQPLLRSAEVYLIVAEAKIRSGGSGDAEINAVRGRVGLATVSGATMVDLMHEKRVELGGENVRWQDMLRWDKAQIIDLTTILNQPKLASPLAPFNGSVDVPARTFVRPKDYFMPIPQEIIDESNGVITQNMNY